MTSTALTQDPNNPKSMCQSNAKCRFSVNSFGTSAIDIAKYKAVCNISDGGGGTAPPTPDAPSQSRNVILILAAVLVPLVLLVLLFRRLLR